MKNGFSKMKIYIYKTERGKVPLIKWLKRQNRRVQDKAFALIEKLAERGNKLGMPHAKVLRDGIWELRINVNNVPYRILYSFVGSGLVLLTNGLQKEDKVPDDEIEKAIGYKKAFLLNPEIHTYEK